MAQVDLKRADISLVPGTGPVVKLKIGEGTLTYTEGRPIQYVKDRGLLDEVRLDKPVPLDVKIDAMWVAIGTDVVVHSNDVPSVPTTVNYAKDLVMETLRGTLLWDDDADGGTTPEVLITSSDSDTTRPFAVHIEVDYVTEGATPNTKIRLPNFRYEQADFDLDAGTISLSGKCFALKAIITETA